MHRCIHVHVVLIPVIVHHLSLVHLGICLHQCTGQNPEWTDVESVVRARLYYSSGKYTRSDFRCVVVLSGDNFSTDWQAESFILTADF